MAADARKVRTDGFCLLIDRAGGEVVAEHPLPVAFDGVVDGVPVPVFHHICAVCQVGKGLQPQLSRPGQSAHRPLSLGFQNEEILPMLQSPRQIAAEADLRPRQERCRGAVNAKTPLLVKAAVFMFA